MNGRSEVAFAARASATGVTGRDHMTVTSITVTKTCKRPFCSLLEFRWDWTVLPTLECTPSAPSRLLLLKRPKYTMAKDKSEKKSKKSKEVTETVEESIVTGEDVEMEDVEVAKVRVNSAGMVDDILIGF